jgi:hypothetical protein
MRNAMLEQRWAVWFDQKWLWMTVRRSKDSIVRHAHDARRLLVLLGSVLFMRPLAGAIFASVS